VNITVLTTGFDAPHIDLVALLRPTESPGLYYQMMGRGLRIHPAKSDCLVLDMSGNIQRHGPIDTLNERIMAPKAKREGGEAPSKTCPNCEEVVPAGVRECPECRFMFPPPEVARHDTRADTASPISDGPEAQPYWIDRITAVAYEPWTKKGADENAPKTLCVSYYQGMVRVAREWVCVEHPMGGFAHTKAMTWLRERLDPSLTMELSPDDSCMVLIGPDGEEILSAATAAEIVKAGLIRQPTRIQVKPDGKFVSVCGYDLATTSTKQPVTTPPDDEEPPF
jgi:DNA repair protein RadD